VETPAAVNPGAGQFTVIPRQGCIFRASHGHRSPLLARKICLPSLPPN